MKEDVDPVTGTVVEVRGIYLYIEYTFDQVLERDRHLGYLRRNLEHL